MLVTDPQTGKPGRGMVSSRKLRQVSVTLSTHKHLLGAYILLVTIVSTGDSTTKTTRTAAIFLATY